MLWLLRRTQRWLSPTKTCHLTFDVVRSIAIRSWRSCPSRRHHLHLRQKKHRTRSTNHLRKPSCANRHLSADASGQATTQRSFQRLGLSGNCLQSPSRMSSLTPGLLVAHYRIDSLLGRGGMGEVYHAVDTYMSRPVAIKVLSPQSIRSEEAVQRFMKEARAATALNHPNKIGRASCRERV